MGLSDVFLCVFLCVLLCVFSCVMRVLMCVPCVFSRVAENLASAHGTELSQADLELLDALGGQGEGARKYCWNAAEIA
jgi:hypothetical protein